MNLGHSKIKPTVGDRYERAVRKQAQISDTSDDDEDPTLSSEIACQTDESGDSILQLVQELRDKLSRLESVVLAGSVVPFGKEAMEAATDAFILHYTGLPNFCVLYSIFAFVQSELHSSTGTKLTPFQEFVLVLMKLRLDASSQDLAYRFDVHASTISRILAKCLSLLCVKLKPLILWPERDNLRRTMPMCFRESFG